MSIGTELFAILALLPAVTAAPVPQSGKAGGSILIALCQGGSIALDTGGNLPARGTAPCCAKGCQNSRARRKLDREQ